jgi:hypothetical protein
MRPLKAIRREVMAVGESIYSTDPTELQPVSATSFREHIAIWIATCSDYFAAAAMYDELRGLSDAELHRRGLSRDTLAREICAACDRRGH